MSGGHDKGHTDARKEAFLSALAVRGTVMAACRASGVPKQTQLSWREADEEFAERFEEALEEFRTSLVQEAVRRGRDGWEEPVIWQGTQAYRRNPRTGDLDLDDDFEPIPLTVIKKSDRILERLLESQVDGFARKSSVELGGQGGGPLPAVVKFVLVDPKEGTETELPPHGEA